MHRPASDREAIEAEIDRVRSLGLDELRTLWRVTFRSPPPSAFTKDLMARFLCWHIQEQAQGGLDLKTAKHLDGLARGAKPRANRPRCLKPGTVFLREYQGERQLARRFRQAGRAVRSTGGVVRVDQGIRTKINGRRDGRRSGGIRFGVGSVAHLLKNRFYIGEVVYRGEVHCGKHEPILARDLFEAVQARCAANAVARQLRLRGSAAPLTGRLFDDRGNRMSPTHANKRGVRYRYYVSHALLQNQRAEAGSIARIPAPEIETLVCDGVRRHLAAMGGTEVATPLAEGELIERHVARVIVKPQALEVCLVPTCETSAQAEDHGLDNLASCHPPTTITLSWTAPSLAAVKGIVHAPCAKPAMGPESRDHRNRQGPGMDRRHQARPHWLFRRDCRAGGAGRTAHPPARPPCLPVAPHHCGDRRWHRTCGPHGHWPRQGPALFVGPARAKDTIAERALCEPVSVNIRIGLRPVEMEIEKRRAETGAQKPAPHGPKWQKLPDRDWGMST